jgi:hypothetical protein
MPCNGADVKPPSLKRLIGKLQPVLFSTVLNEVRTTKRVYERWKHTDVSSRDVIVCFYPNFTVE